MLFALKQWFALTLSKDRLRAMLIDSLRQRQLLANLLLNILILVFGSCVFEWTWVIRQFELLEFPERVFVTKDGPHTRLQEVTCEVGGLVLSVGVAVLLFY